MARSIHGRFYVGGNFTTVKRGEIPRGPFNDMLKYSKIRKEDFQKALAAFAAALTLDVDDLN